MKKTFALLLSVLMLLSLCACGSSGNYQKAESAAGSYYTSAPMEAPAAMADEGYWAESEEAYGGFSSNELRVEKTAGSSNLAAEEKPAIDPEKIIYSASATVETTEFDQTLERLQVMIDQIGGFIESSSVSGNNYYSSSRGYGSNRSASYTLRVPSQRFQELMNGLSTLGNVPYSNTYSENITARYYDVQSRLNAYRTQEERLLEMMEQAETVTDLITIEDRLTELRYEIESLQSSLNNWDRQVSYSTVSLSINEVTVYTPEAKMSYAQQLGLAIRSGLQGTADFFSGLLLWLLEALPALIVLAVIVFVIVLIVKKSVKKSREKKLRQQPRPAQPVQNTENK